MRKKLIFICIVALVAGVVVLLDPRNSGFSWGKRDTSWYAVYLTNNQVYFGHIASIKDDVLVLEDAYFAEAYQEPAQVAKGKTFAIEQPAKQAFRVTQRGNEKMLSSDHKLFINRSSVLYWEKFSPNAGIVKLIEEAK